MAETSIYEEANMRDAQEIMNYFETPEKSLQYREKEMIEIQDINLGNYTSARINFSTQNNLHDFLLWSKAYVTFELKFVSADGGNAYTAGTELALRDGVSSLVYGLILKINDTTVQKTLDLPLMNHIRSVYGDLGCYDRDCGAEEHRAYDRVIDPEVTDVAGANVVTNSGTDADITSITYNEGYDKRRQFFKRNSYFLTGDASWNLECRVPLTAISPVFRALNMPMNNLQMDIELAITGAGPAGGSSVCYTVAGATDSLRNEATVTIQSNPRPRLWVPAVEFDADTMSDIRAQQDPSKHPNGNWKVFKFENHESYLKPLGVLVAGAPINETVTPGLRNVTSVHVLGQSRSAYTNAVGGNSLKPMLDNPQHVGYWSDFAMTGVDLIVDNRGFFERPIDDDHLAYNQLVKEHMRGDGYDKACCSRPSFEEFRSVRRYYSFPLGRNRNIQADANKKVAIDFRAKRADALVTPRTNITQNSYSPLAASVDLRFLLAYTTIFKVNLVNGTTVVTDK